MKALIEHYEEIGESVDMPAYYEFSDWYDDVVNRWMNEVFPRKNVLTFVFRWRCAGKNGFNLE